MQATVVLRQVMWFNDTGLMCPLECFVSLQSVSCGSHSLIVETFWPFVSTECWVLNHKCGRFKCPQGHMTEGTFFHTVALSLVDLSWNTEILKGYLQSRLPDLSLCVISDLPLILHTFFSNILSVYWLNYFITSYMIAVKFILTTYSNLNLIKIKLSYKHVF